MFNTAVTQQPVFTQVFPAINFTAAVGGVSNLTRPFTDVVTDAAGTVVGTVAAQGNDARAGVGALYNFAAVFTGSLQVPAAGPVTFTITASDGFVFGVGNGAARVSGPQVGVPGVTAFSGLAVMGGVNVAASTTALGGLQSNPAVVGWVIPQQNVTLTKVVGRFFRSDGQGSFNTPPS